MQVFPRHIVFLLCNAKPKMFCHHLSLLQTVVHLCTRISVYLAEGLITEDVMEKCGSARIREEGELGGAVKCTAFKSSVFFYTVLSQ